MRIKKKQKVKLREQLACIEVITYNKVLLEINRSQLVKE